MAKLTVTVSDAIRSEIERRRESNETGSVFRKRTLSEEVEELLRTALKAQASEHYLLLKIDDGLWAWLKAHVAGIGLAGSMEDTAIYMIRTSLIDDVKSKAFEDMMYPHLPESIQKALGARG